MDVGDIEILPVMDGVIRSRLRANKALPEPGTPAWEAQHGTFLPGGMHESAVGAFLVRSGDRLALVDAGSGASLPGPIRPVIDADDPDDPVVVMLRGRGVPDDMMRQLIADFVKTEIVRGELPASLARLGIRPDEITDVIFTHLHFDHIGWATDDDSAFFPNARLWCASADLEHFLPGTSEDQMTSLVYQALTVPERLGPVLDRLETWDTDQTLMPGIDVRLAPGHTPGSSVVVVSDGVERAMLLGDIIHCPLELMDDDFNLLVDYDQEQANRVREAYARELEDGEIPIAAAHFPGLRFGRLLPGVGVRSWRFEPNGS